MAKKRKPKKEDKEQSQRFVEAAHDLAIDESGKSFENAIDAISKKNFKTKRLAPNRE